jgi:UDP-N-acetylmuramyl tripeptide synthase
LGNMSPYAVVVLVEVAEKITMDAEPVLDGSAVLVAVTVTVDGDGTAEGAVYSPAPLTVPHAAELQPAPCTVHVTAVFEVPTTDALNCCVAPITTDVLAGVTVTTTTATMVTLADAVLLGSAILVATTLMLGGEGATSGAV